MSKQELIMKFSKHLCSAALAVGMTMVAAGAAMAADNTGPSVPGGIGPATASGDRWAVIGSGCVFARGKGVVAVTRGDTAIGTCIVFFNKDITRCVYTATVGLPGTTGVSPPGFV